MSVTTKATIVVPAKPLCSRCGKRVRAVVQFRSVSSEHGLRNPGRRGTTRYIGLCMACLDELRNELRRYKP